MKHLIVAADDFGLTKSVNEGIVRSHEEGIVTSINLLPCGEAYDDALKLAKDIGLCEIGAHLALTETKSITDSSKIATLVDREGNFYRGHTQFFLKFLTGAINLEQVYIEWRAQLDKACASGIKITNLSSHEHIHMQPLLLDIIIKLAKEYNIPAIRYPHADRSYGRASLKTLCKTFILSHFAPAVGRALKSSGMVSPDHFLGFLDSGNITENILLGILNTIEDGTTELVCHPGFLGPEILEKYTFHKGCETELFALTSRHVKKRADEKHVGLLSYAEFLASHKA